MKQIQGSSRQPHRVIGKHDEIKTLPLKQVDTSEQDESYQTKHRAAQNFINSHRKANPMTKSGQDELNKSENQQQQQQILTLLRKSPYKASEESTKPEEPKVEKKEKLLSAKGNYFVQPIKPVTLKEETQESKIKQKVPEQKNPKQVEFSPKSDRKITVQDQQFAKLLNNVLKAPPHKQETPNRKQPDEKNQKVQNESNNITVQQQQKQETIIKKSPMDQEKASIIIQKHYKGYKAKKVYKQNKSKRNLYRYNVVAELVKTEQNYVKDLQIIVNFLMDPIKKSKLINTKEQQGLFSNLREIVQLNEAFLNSLNQKFEQFNEKTCIGKVAIDYGPFFKLYFSYANEFKGVQSTCEQLKKSNPNFTEFLKTQERLPEFRCMNFDDFMIKPIQRLPKYVLFMQDLVKHTLKTHPDYNDLKKALNLFLQVNHSNNENMNRILSGPKLFELSRLYQNELDGIQLVNGKRMYRGESIRRIQWENKEIQVVVYYLSDMLLLINERIGYKPMLVLAIVINELSVCNDLPNTQFYKNLLQLVGSNSSVIFMEDSEQSKKEHIELLEKLIKEIKESSDSRTEALKMRAGTEYQKNKVNLQSVQVEVLGTEERAHCTIYYVVQVSIEEIKQRLYLRFKDCIEIREQAKKQFSNLKLQTLNLGMFASETSDLKSQETASIQVQTFLAGLLNSVQFQEKPEKILHLLGLPSNFLELPKIFRDQIKSDADTFTNSRLANRKNSNLMSSQIQTSSFLSFSSTGGRESLGLFSKKQSRGFSAAKLLHSQNYLNQGKQHSVEPSIQMKNGGFGLFSNSSKQNLQTLQITVVTHHNSYTQILLDVGPKACALDLYQTLEKQLSIQDSWDFRFMVADAAHQELRALADEEILFNVLEERGNILKKMISQSEKKVFFKKYLYFDQRRELLDYQKDPCKMHLVYNQTVNEVKCGDYAFSFKEYLAISAVYMHSQAQQISDQTIKQVLPEYAIKFTTLANWKQGIQQYMKQLDSMVKDQGSYLSVEFVRNIFIALVQKKDLYGAQLFMGEEVSDNKKQSDQIVMIGIKHSVVLVLKPKNKEITRIIPYDHIQKIKGLAGSLVLECNGQEIKFKTPHGYQIQTLIEEYQELADTLDESNDEQRKKVEDIISLANSISKFKLNANLEGQ